MPSYFQKFATSLSLASLFVLSASCAPKASTTGKNEGKKPAEESGDDMKKVDPNAKAISTEFRNNSFINLKVFESATKEVTLKNMASNKDVTVFQFSGVACASCKDSSPVIRSGVDKLGSQVQVVVLFPNPKSAFSTTKEYLSFVNSYSKNSRFAVDDTRIVQKTIRASEDDFFGMYMVVKKDGTSVIFPNEETKPQLVLDAVEKALEQK